VGAHSDRWGSHWAGEGSRWPRGPHRPLFFSDVIWIGRFLVCSTRFGFHDGFRVALFAGYRKSRFLRVTAMPTAKYPWEMRFRLCPPGQNSVSSMTSSYWPPVPTYRQAWITSLFHDGRAELLRVQESAASGPIVYCPYFKDGIRAEKQKGNVQRILTTAAFLQICGYIWYDGGLNSVQNSV